MGDTIRRLPDGELEVMQAVWACQEPAALAAISRIVQQTHPVGQTTLLTELRRLEGKGFIRIVRASPRYRYIPLVSKADYLARQSRDFVERVCGGVSAFANALCHSGLSKEELEQLRDLLDRGEL